MNPSFNHLMTLSSTIENVIEESNFELEEETSNSGVYENFYQSDKEESFVEVKSDDLIGGILKTTTLRKN